MKNLTSAFLLPVFNAEKTIKRAIQSILDQDYKEFKLIIIEIFHFKILMNLIFNMITLIMNIKNMKIMIIIFLFH